MKRFRMQAINFTSHDLSFGQANKKDNKGKPTMKRRRLRKLYLKGILNSIKSMGTKRLTTLSSRNDLKRKKMQKVTV